MEFCEEQVDGAVEQVMVEREEDMIVAMCYVAEQLTFGRQIDLEGFNVELQRQKMIDIFLTLLTFDSE
jgi:predicted ABC-type sugar transport system permease subunit